MRFELTPDQRALQDEAETFCRGLAPLLEADPALRLQGMPSDGDSLAVHERLGAANLIGVPWPVRFGGRGLGHLDAALVEEVLGYHWLPLSSYLLSSKTIGAALLSYATPELAERLLPPIAAGELVFCQGFSEPEAGSDLAALRTTARRVGDRFVVDGHKIWTSGASGSDWIYLAVRTDPDASRHRGVSVLVAEMSSPGITVRPFDTLGGGSLAEVFLDGVEVPADQLVGELHGGWTVLMHTLDLERVTAEKVGALSWLLAALDAALPGRTPAVALRLAALRGEVEACRLLSRRAAALLDLGRDASAAASMAKLATGVLAQTLSAAAVELQGIAGLEDGSGPLAGRAAAMARASVAATISGGSAEIQRIVIARRGLA